MNTNKEMMKQEIMQTVTNALTEYFTKQGKSDYVPVVLAYGFVEDDIRREVEYVSSMSDEEAEAELSRFMDDMFNCRKASIEERIQADMYDMVDMFRDRAFQNLQPEEDVKKKYEAHEPIDLEKYPEELNRLDEIDYLLDILEALKRQIDDGEIGDEEMLKHVIDYLEDCELPWSEMTPEEGADALITRIIENYKEERTIAFVCEYWNEVLSMLKNDWADIVRDDLHRNPDDYEDEIPEFYEDFIYGPGSDMESFVTQYVRQNYPNGGWDEADVRETVAEMLEELDVQATWYVWAEDNDGGEDWSNGSYDYEEAMTEAKKLYEAGCEEANVLVIKLDDCGGECKDVRYVRDII